MRVFPAFCTVMDSGSSARCIVGIIVEVLAAFCQGQNVGLKCSLKVKGLEI